MFLCASGIVNTLPIRGHNDSTSRQIHDHSQDTTIQQAHKYMTDHRQQRFNKHTNTWPIVACDRSCICVLVESLWPVIGHVFVCLLNRCGLWSVMYLCACWIVVACERSCTSRQIHDQSQATTIQQAHKNMTDQRQQRFNKHTNTWPIKGRDSISRQMHDRHVFVCFLNLCDLLSVMYLSANGIVVVCDRSCICVLVKSLLPVIDHVFVCLLNHCGLWSVMYLCACGNNDSISRQIHDR
jgi:hypothetical protein